MSKMGCYGHKLTINLILYPLIDLYESFSSLLAISSRIMAQIGCGISVVGHLVCLELSSSLLFMTIMNRNNAQFLK